MTDAAARRWQFGIRHLLVVMLFVAGTAGVRLAVYRLGSAVVRL